MNEHVYSIRSDVIEDDGVTAIKKLAEEGNVVFVDFDKLYKNSRDEKNKKRFSYIDTLKCINENGRKNEQNKREVLMNTGGRVILHSGEAPDVFEDTPTTHITRDIAVQTKLEIEGKITTFPKFLVYGTETLNHGIVNLEINKNLIELTKGDISTLPKVPFNELLDCIETPIVNNQYLKFNNVIFKVEYETRSTDQFKSRFVQSDSGILTRVFPDNMIQSPFKGFKPRNLEQKLLFSNLMDKNIELHIVNGGSGSGKTVVTYAAAVQSILGTSTDRKKGKIKDGIVLFKSNDLIGGKTREMGFLPGTLYEKALPYLKSYIDAHNLCGLGDEIDFEQMLAHPAKDNEITKKRTGKLQLGEGLHLPSRNPAIEIEYLQYARGRTFENKTIIVDEAQNYSPFEMKQLLERIGVGCTIYLVGDPIGQIDNPRLDETYNGFTYAAKTNFGIHPRLSIISLDQNFRSQTAEIARNTRAPRD